MNFDELRTFIVKRKIKRLQANYQPVVIKALIENDLNLERKKLIKIIQEQNLDLSSEKANEIPVFKVLKKGIIVNEDKDILYLDIKELTSDHKKELISLCDEWIYNVKIRKELDQLEKLGVSYDVIQSLKKFWKLRGKIKTRDQMKGIGVTDEDEVEGEIMHGTVRGVYKAEGENYVQSIQTNPHSKYEMELDSLHPTIKLNYIFKDKKDYDDDIKLLEKSFENNVPIGIVIVLAPNKWKILGLCRITEHPSKRHFVFESYGISEQESSRLRDETFEEFDKYNVSSDLKKIHILEWRSFSPQIDPLELRFQKITENPPSLQKEPAHIEEIIKNIENGMWAIPDFQRYYRWSQKDVKDFLKSIFDDHYIGGLLLWNIEDTDKKQCGMIEVEGSNPSELKGDRIVLDGQQRITSLHYAINAPEETEKTKETHPGFFYINFGKYFLDSNNDDMETIVALNRKITDEESFERLLFPFYKLKTLQKDDWLSKLKKFVKKYQTVDSDDLDDIVEIIRKKTNRIYHTYEIPQIVLSNTTFENVGTIFMNINTRGKPLDVFDLINVKMAAYGVKVRDLWEKTLKQFPKIHEYESQMTTRMGRYIMEIISLSNSALKSCKKNDILEMFGRERKEDKRWTAEKFEQMWDESAKYLNFAIKRLEDKNIGFGVIIPEVLPYEPMLPILASLLKEIETTFKDDSVNCYRKLERWYWTSVFGERFSESVEAKKSSDYKEMIEWFKPNSETPKFIKDFQNNFKNIQLEDSFKKDSVLYTGVLCLLAKKGAVDFEIRFSSKDSSPHMDHIFPKSRIEHHKNKNSILNMTWLSPETNVGTKKAKMPSKYILEVREKKYKNEKEFRKVLASHLINDDAYDCLLHDEFDNFIKYRKIEILKEIANQIDTVYVEEEIEDDTPNSIYVKSIEELIQMDEDDELEFKATLKYNRRAKIPDKIMLQEVVATIAGFMNSRKGGLLVVGYDEDLDEVNGIEEDYPHTGNKKFDSWRGTLMSSFSEHCKKEFEIFIDSIIPVDYEGKTVVKVIVKHSDKPVFYDEEFYRRSHGKTQKLVGSDMHNYINRMWSELK